MIGQGGNHGPQFQTGQPPVPPSPPSSALVPPPLQQPNAQMAPPPPPSFRQANSQVTQPPPPSFQQINSLMAPPPPPPPSFQQALAPTGQGQLPSQGFPPPQPDQQRESHSVGLRPLSSPSPLPYQQGVPASSHQSISPMRQPYLRPPPNYGSTPVVRSYPLQTQPYASPISTNSFHNVISPVPSPNRGPPPPPLSQGQALYRIPLPPSSGIQHVLGLPPPAPPSLTSTPASFVCEPPSHGLPPVLPPPPPPPPPPPALSPPPPPLVPSSPPPLPSSPPPPTSTASDSIVADSKVQSLEQESNSATADHHIDGTPGKRVLGGDDCSGIPSPCPASEQPKSPLASVAVDKVSSVPAVDSDMDMGDDDYSFCEDLSPPDSPVANKSTIECAVPESAESTLSDMLPSPIRCNKDGDNSRVVVNDGSPFRHIQVYASDDSSEDEKEISISDVHPVGSSPKVAPSQSVSRKENFDVYNASEATLLETRAHVPSILVETFHASGTTGPSHHEGTQNHISSTVIEGTKMSSIEVTFASPVESDRIGNPVSCSQDDHTLAEKETSETSHQIAISEHGNDDSLHRNRTFHPEEDATDGSSMPKVDEFGRMVREGVSDSDSDDMQYQRKHGRRGRGSNRSLSPREDRWRSGPRRRKEMRSRSCSWSPKRQRLRSKSPPAYRNHGDFTRRGHSEVPKCFHFMRGWCSRGASCRYLHHEHGRNRVNTQKYEGIPHHSYKHDAYDLLHEGYEAEHDSKNKIKESEVHDNIPGEDNADLKILRRNDNLVCSIQDPDDVSDVNDNVKDSASDMAKNVISHPEFSKDVEQEHGSVEQTQPMQKEKTLLTQEAEKHLDLRPKEETLYQPKCVSLELIELMQKEKDLPTRDANEDLQKLDDVSLQQSEEVRSNGSSERIKILNMNANGEHSHSETTYHHQSCKNTPPHHPLPTFTPVLDQGTQSVGLQQPHVEVTSISHSSDAVAAETLPRWSSAAKPTSDQLTISRPCAAVFNQPFRTDATASQLMHASEGQTSVIPASAQQSHPLSTLPSFAVHSAGHHAPYTVPSFRAEQFTSQQHPEQFAYPQQHSLGSSHHSTYPQKSWSNTSQPLYYSGASVPTYHNPDFKPAHFAQNAIPPRNEIQARPDMRLPVGSQYPGPVFGQMEETSHPFVAVDARSFTGPPIHHNVGHSHPTGEETQVPFQQHNVASTSFAQGNVNHTQSSIHWEPFARSIQSFPGDSMPPRAFSKEGFDNSGMAFRYPHQEPADALQQSAGRVFPSSITTPTTGSPVMDYQKNFQENNLTSGIPKISAAAHYNPFASTFEKHHGARLSASDSRIEGTLFSGSGGKFPLALSAEFRYYLHTQEPGTQKQHGKEASAGDPYDPLFDSIDDPSNVSKKFNHPLNKDSAGVQMTNFGNDEVGETATDAEVGAVEDGSPLPGIGPDWSPGIQDDPVDKVGGDSDTERLPSQGKSKKSKESRSTKLFRIAVANFVKEVLKPSWRQGNLSKEAFKTIVKKTVDKVSSTMPGHRVPKSQTKIDQYVESSQQKLTKLVMGYVDKYVKT